MLYAYDIACSVNFVHLQPLNLPKLLGKASLTPKSRNLA